MSTVLGERIGEDRRRGVAIIGHGDSTSTLLAVASIMGALGGAGVPYRVYDTPMVPRSQPKRQKRHQGDKERERRMKQETKRYVYCHACSLAGGADLPIYHLSPVCPTEEAAIPTGTAICKMPDWAG